MAVHRRQPLPARSHGGQVVVVNPRTEEVDHDGSSGNRTPFSISDTTVLDAGVS